MDETRYELGRPVGGETVDLLAQHDVGTREHEQRADGAQPEGDGHELGPGDIGCVVGRAPVRLDEDPNQRKKSQSKRNRQLI